MTLRIDKISVSRSRKIAVKAYENEDIAICLDATVNEDFEQNALNVHYDNILNFLDKKIDDFVKIKSGERKPLVESLPEIEDNKPKTISDQAFHDIMQRFIISLGKDRVRSELLDFGNHVNISQILIDQRPLFIEKLAKIQKNEVKNG